MKKTNITRIHTKKFSGRTFNIKRLFRRKVILSILILAVILSGILWQYLMVHNDDLLSNPVGDYINLGGYQAHYYSKGDGDLAFVFITGSGTPCAYTDFYHLQNVLSKFGQTVTFDHAGSGWSSKATTIRSIDNLVEELSQLIDSICPFKDIVLICHSLGSLETIGYAQSHPDRIKGIVFLDSGSPEFYSKDSELRAKLINRGTAFIRTLGLNRLFGEFGFFLPLYGESLRNPNLPDNVQLIDQSFYYRMAGNPSSFDTIKLMNENATKLLDGPTLGNIPTLVLSSDSGDEWNKVQLQLAKWSTNSSQITIKNAEHYLYWSNRDSVISQIEDFIIRGRLYNE